MWSRVDRVALVYYPKDHVRAISLLAKAQSSFYLKAGVAQLLGKKMVIRKLTS